MEWSNPTTQLAVVISLTILIAEVARRFIRHHIKRQGGPLPPGPFPLPLIGSVFAVNDKEPWLTYTEWRAKYGDIVYTRLLDTGVVVLNSPSVAKDLLEKRSEVYSDRPFIATIEPYGHDTDFAFAQYGEHWRLCRRIFHQMFRPDAALAFRPIQLRRAREMVLNIIQDPDGYPVYYTRFSATVGMSIVYDYEPQSGDEAIMSLMSEFLEATMPALTSGRAVLLKMFPFLLHVPDWFPGSSIKLEARKATMLRDRILEMTYHYAQKRMNSGDSTSESLSSEHIRHVKKSDGHHRAQYETAFKHVSLSAILGSLETTASTIMVFTLAMVKHPRVWERAQAEIDAVVGLDRLPGFDDRQSLPYVDAVVREVIRWKPVAPLGVPHANTRSDNYQGFYIPKGVNVITNIWAMSQDKDRYPNPEEFVPERFLDEQGQLTEDDPAEFIFGFGRRICPGRHTGDTSVWSAIATMLATIDFNGPEDGICEATFTNGLTYHPTKFPCRLSPRAHVTQEALKHG